MTRFSRSIDLLAAIAVAGIAVALTASAPAGSELRVAACLLLALYLSGYSFLAAFYPNSPIEAPARLVLSLGLSIALAALLGLVLNWPDSGLDLTNWRIGLGGLTIVLALVGLIRRDLTVGRFRPSLSFVWLGLAVTPVIVLAVIAVINSSNSAADQPQPGFSVLAADVSESGDVRVTVINKQHELENYRLVATAGSKEIDQWRDRLEPGKSWTVSIPASERLGSSQIDLELFKTPGLAPYRAVSIPPPDGSTEGVEG